ncbi:polysaccharide biosynthesis protein [Aeromicrobium marinum DSM 15272]|uniref:Polysaccharide biosynthesis protein n=1 Tax=Aeromicrobium marinum DSM 15272 TaxID=585531 RepID=E2SFG5_9ACTN|nr:oligosaccharide flippase family protein [Aeromicrobium marinum]EFQ82066.1 polysaccharide biosynthesis protein [Aeromicrobium marinum DSM 15272]
MTDEGGATPAPRGPGTARTAVVVIVGTFGLQALTTVTGIVTARILGVEGRGVVALVFALSLLASQLTFGGSLPTALAKNIAERRVATRDGLRGIVRRRGWLVLIPAVAVAGGLAWLSRDDPSTDTVAVAAIVLVLTLQTIASRLLIAALQGEINALERMVVVALVPHALYVLVLGTVWVAGWSWSPEAVLAAFIGVSTVGLLVAVLALAPPTGRAEDALDESRLWTDARQTYVSSVRPLDSIGLDRILVGGLLGNAALGLYASAIAVANLCGIVGNAVAIIVLPQVARSHDDPAAQRAVARRWIGLTVVFVALVVVALQVVVEPVIRLAFGEEFVGAVEVARWLIVADGFFGVRKVLIAVLQGQGRGTTASWIELALTPVLAAGIVVASLADELPAVGMSMVVVAVLSCLALGVAVRRTPRVVSS